MSSDSNRKNLNINQVDLAEFLCEGIRQAAKESTSEEEFKFKVQALLDGALKELGIEYEVHLEKTVYKSRRADALYPAVVIEYKKPRTLRNKRVLDKAILELSYYLRGLSGKEEATRKHVGVALDGERILFLRGRPSAMQDYPKEGQTTLDGKVLETLPKLEIMGPYPVNKATTEQLLIFLRTLRYKVLNPENLQNDFGPRSSIGAKAVQYFHKKLASSKVPKVSVLYSEWNRLFGIIYGEELRKAERDVKQFAKVYGIKKRNVDLKRVLFSIHTYFALIMKMIAAEVLAIQHGGILSSFVKRWVFLEGPDLKSAFEDLESGGLFRGLGIMNFLEGDFFAWYIEEWDAQVVSLIREMARLLADYEPAATKIEPDEVRDLLKRLYQYLVPKSIRHDLGEYYTPDWLAEIVLDEIDYYGDPDKRLLDPACGSGTFLTLAVKRVLKRMEDFPEKYNQAKVLSNVLSNIVGFDINPIAVLAARTNYLIAISSLRRLGAQKIEIPVYLSDSILTPRLYASLHGARFSVSTSVGEFSIPQSLARKGLMEKILSVLEEVVGYHGSLEVFFERLKGESMIEVDSQTKGDLGKLFQKIKDLDGEGKNRIWTRIMKNNFAPMYVGKFDYVIGNPPWINWGNLAAEYREATSSLWWDYGLFRKKGFKARLGGIASIDFSMLFLYSCIDKYLRDKAELGFVITQSIFKTKGLGGQHFRGFTLGKDPNDTPMKVIKVYDLVELKPFEKATNRTALVFVRKGEATEYPVPYLLWRKKSRGPIDPELSLEEVKDRVRVLELLAEPISKKDPTSPWLTTVEGLPLRKTLGRSKYKGHIGVHTWLNGVYWMDIKRKLPNQLLLVENLHDVGRNVVKRVEKVIESRFVYPLLRGRDIQKWSAQPSLHILQMHDPVTRKGYDEALVQANFPRTYEYLKEFEADLRSRPGYIKYWCRVKTSPSGKQELIEKAPFYSMYDVGDYTLSQFKVVWKEQATRLTSAVVSKVRDQNLGEKLVIPDHKVTFVASGSEDEAHYICAILNSSILGLLTKMYVIETQISTHIFEYAKIPIYDSKDKLHRSLGNLSKRAHELAEKREVTKLREIEQEIDLVVAKLFKIRKRELSQIQEILAKLIS